MLWRSLSAKSGINIVNLVDAALNYQTADRFEDRNKIMTYLTRSIDQYVYMRKRKPKRFDFIRRFLAFLLCVPGRRMGSYLLILFFVTKMLFIANSLGQLFLLNIFLGHNFASYGVELIQKILNGEELAESMYFPRVTMCEFAVRNIQNVHVHTVQVKGPEGRERDGCRRASVRSSVYYRSIYSMRKPFSSFGFGSPFSRYAIRTIYSPGLCVRSVGCVILTSRNVSNSCKVTHIYDECQRKISFIDTCNTTVYWSFDFSPIIPAIWSWQNWSSSCGNSINEQEVEAEPVDLVRRQARRSLHLPCPRRLAQVQRVADRWVYVCSMPVVASVLAEMICEWVSVLCILYSLVFNSPCSGSSSSFSSLSFSLFVCFSFFRFCHAYAW